MSADEWGLSRRQQERLREVLRDDERVQRDGCCQKSSSSSSRARGWASR